VSACAAGLGLGVLAGWWRGDEPGPGEPAADELEAHFFGCDACTRRLGWIAAVADAYAAVMHRRGGVDLALTASMVERLAQAGVVMRQYRPGPNEDVACTVTLDDDLTVSWIPVAPAAGERVDVLMTAPDGTAFIALEDAPVDPATGCVIHARAAEGLRPLPAIDLRLRVLGVGPAGTRTLAEHTFRHRPS
jgi:hypothetical protein